MSSTTIPLCIPRVGFGCFLVRVGISVSTWCVLLVCPWLLGVIYGFMTFFGWFSCLALHHPLFVAPTQYHFPIHGFFLVGSLAFHHPLLVVWTHYLYCTLLRKYCAAVSFIKYVSTAADSTVLMTTHEVPFI